MTRRSMYGEPLRSRPPSLSSTLIIEPTLGLDVEHAQQNLKPGATPSADNYIMREGALEPRPMLSLTSLLQPFSGTTGPVLGGYEVVDVVGTRYPFVSTTTAVAYFSANSWSRASYVSAYGLSDPPNGSATSYWDITQIYDATSNQNLAVMANGSYQSLYVWKSGSTLFSTLTGAPAALYVDSYDNYLLAFNLKDNSGNNLVQRVQWSDRGSASSWTGGLSGFQDLLDMRGQGTRVVGQDNRIILFSEYEIWQGVEDNFPFVFNFAAFDKNIGCPYPWTVTKTPIGLMFLGRDLNVWWLPKSGGPAKQVGDAVWRFLRPTIDTPERAWGMYDSQSNTYQLYYCVTGGSGYPQKALYLDLTGSLSGLGAGSFYGVLSNAPNWAPQSFDPVGGTLSVTRGFEANLPASSGTAWSQTSAVGITWASDPFTSWTQLQAPLSGWKRAPFVGSSSGTMYYANSNATSDNGTPVLSYWQSSPYGGEEPDRQKTMTAVRVDYQASSAASVTIQVAQDLGDNFAPGIPLALPATSSGSQVRADTYTTGRYPSIKVSSTGFRYRLRRFWATIRMQGR